ncbi:c-type cytochrome [Rhodanobacter ginsengisoli]|uniref:C-type cytochrome n=1 Tax=Rhodanobacter ginsengisoli TaxID=418646 RepID=A0ABW0QJ63_9GAMM
MKTMTAGRRTAGRTAALVWLIAAGSAPVMAQRIGNVYGPALQAADGEQIYAHICRGCHMPKGQGAIGAGRYPALAGDPALASASFVALTVLNGRRNMPRFAPRADAGEFFFAMPVLSDAQVAAVTNYVRTHFGNHYSDRITAAEVRALPH